MINVVVIWGYKYISGCPGMDTSCIAWEYNRDRDISFYFIISALFLPLFSLSAALILFMTDLEFHTDNLCDYC